MSHHHQRDRIPTEKQCWEWLHSLRSTVTSTQGCQGNWLDLRGRVFLVQERAYWGRQMLKWTRLISERWGGLISERSFEGKFTQEWHSPLSWSRRPARYRQPYNLGFFPGLQLPYRRLSNVTLAAQKPWTGLWDWGVWPIAHWWEIALSLETLPCLDFKSLPCFFPSSIPQPDFLSPSRCSILLRGPWATELRGGGVCISFYTRGIGPVQLAVRCWASHLTSLCFSCHNSKVGIMIAFTWNGC